MREIVLRVFMDGYDKPVRQAFQPDPGNSTFSLCAGETPAPQPEATTASIVVQASSLQWSGFPAWLLRKAGASGSKA